MECVQCLHAELKPEQYVSTSTHRVSHVGPTKNGGPLATENTPKNVLAESGIDAFVAGYGVRV